MTESNFDGAAAPFSRPVAVDSIGEKGQRLKFQASEAECAALAEQDGLVALRDLVVEAEVSRRGREGLYARGRVTAFVTQNCVVTLEPFEASIEEPFEIEFAPQAEAEAAYAKAMAEIEAARDKAAALAEQKDPPDPIIDGKVDFGALGAEFLALGIDPHPRKPGASFQEIVDPTAEEKPSPFAALAKIKKD
ncbi:YceD family protein [Rhodoblastus sp.]|uniref:YceD family protein n=1 Tax=Rhodoblastus sp. TaxID=1962975 RepID=UPI003F9C2DC1